MKEIKLVVVDDSELIREYIKRALLSIKGCDVVGIASNGDEGMSMIRTLNPDVVLLDVRMPVRSGLEILREIRQEDPKVTVIMFTADAHPALSEKCLNEGANYFVCKTEFRQLANILADLQRD